MYSCVLSGAVDDGCLWFHVTVMATLCVCVCILHDDIMCCVGRSGVGDRGCGMCGLVCGVCLCNMCSLLHFVYIGMCFDLVLFDVLCWAYWLCWLRWFVSDPVVIALGVLCFVFVAL